MPAAKFPRNPFDLSVFPQGSSKKDFFRALHDGDVAAVRRTLDRTPGAVHWTDARGQTALGVAVIAYYDDSSWPSRVEHSKELVELLLKRGADANAKDAAGLAPLLLEAQRFARRDVTEALLRGGAQADATGPKGRAALHDAADRGQTDMVEALLRHKARRDAQDDDGNTPLHLAVGVHGHPGYSGTIGTLLKAGAAADIKNRAGQTALDAALENPDFHEYREAYSANMIRAALAARAAAAPGEAAEKKDDAPGNDPIGGTRRPVVLPPPVKFRKPPTGPA